MSPSVDRDHGDVVLAACTDCVLVTKTNPGPGLNNTVDDAQYQSPVQQHKYDAPKTPSNLIESLKHLMHQEHSTKAGAIRPFEYLRMRIVEVYLTTDLTKQPYRLSPDLMQLESGFFKDQMKSAEETTDTPKIYLSDIEHTYMDIVVDWIHGVRLETFKKQVNFYPITLYSVANRLKMPGLQDDIMDFFRQCLLERRRQVAYNGIRRCLDEDLIGTPMWEFSLRSCVHGIMHKMNCHSMAKIQDNEVMGEIGREVAKYVIQPYQDPRTDAMCNFHVDETLSQDNCAEEQEVAACEMVNPKKSV